MSRSTADWARAGLVPAVAALFLLSAGPSAGQQAVELAHQGAVSAPERSAPAEADMTKVKGSTGEKAAAKDATFYRSSTIDAAAKSTGADKAAVRSSIAAKGAGRSPVAPSVPAASTATVEPKPDVTGTAGLAKAAAAGEAKPDAGTTQSALSGAGDPAPSQAGSDPVKAALPALNEPRADDSVPQKKPGAESSQAAASDTPPSDGKVAAPESKPDQPAAGAPAAKSTATASEPADGKPAVAEPTTSKPPQAAPQPDLSPVKVLSPVEAKPVPAAGPVKPAAARADAPPVKDVLPAESKPQPVAEPIKAAAVVAEPVVAKDVAPADAKAGESTQQPAPAPSQTAKAEATEPTLPTEKPIAKPDAKEPAGAAAPTSTAALSNPADDAGLSGVVDEALQAADSIVMAARQKIPSAARGASADEVAALAAFYEERNGPAIWAATSGLTAKGKAVIEEIGKADDWGLPASDFDLPRAAPGPLDADAAADLEIKVALAILKYARYARGGRVNPLSISQLLDLSPPLIQPQTVLTDISILDAPEGYLRSLHPRHKQFELLRQALLKMRSPSEKAEEPEAEEDPALSVKLPPGRILKPGMEDEQIALLRQRLKVSAEDAADENVYDEKLQEAVREFQRANSLRPDAIVGNNTRTVLNGQPRPASPTTEARIERILINMERWRWMPEDLGDFYVWDNVPEFLTRVVKDHKIIHTDKIIVGQPSWPTPSFSADMKHVVFNPSWGVPDGIKTKELWPLLRKSSGAGFFGIFGGGYSSQAVLDAYDLRVYQNGRQIDANQVDWNSVDIRRFSFQQPPGPKNVLGAVKFMFPNRHDVYMHDTPERHLFARSFRALSHGCMRVGDPRRFAEIVLGEDKGWSPEKVRGMFGGYSAEVKLDKHIPVHVTYITARVDDNGKLQTYGDFYGLDSRVASALLGRNVRFEQPVYADEEVAATGADPVESSIRRAGAARKKQQYGGPTTLTDAINGLFSP